MRTRAFSLVELLVVVAIIALMLGILLPTMSRSRSHAINLRCQVNQGNLGKALMQYTQDNNNLTMPVAHDGNKYWFHFIGRYVGDPSYRLNPEERQKGEMWVTHCPRTKRREPGTFAYGTAFWDWTWEGGTGSYGMNLWLNPEGLFKDDTANIKPQDGYFFTTLDIHSPAQTPVFCDANWVGGWPDDEDLVPSNLTRGMYAHQYRYFMGRFCIDRHHGRINQSFQDGSVRGVQLKELWQLYWHKLFEPNNDIQIP